MQTIEGWLTIEEVGPQWEEHDALLVKDGSPTDGIPLAERLSFIDMKQVTVRYWVCEQKCTKDQAAEEFVRTCMGMCDADYGARYSEYTGYLWTDENLQVGGHDIMAELRSYVGQWLILEIQVH